MLCWYIPAKDVRARLAQELAFTMNIGKKDAEFLTMKRKPSLRQTDCLTQGEGSLMVPDFPC